MKGVSNGRRRTQHINDNYDPTPQCRGIDQIGQQMHMERSNRHNTQF
jgi:hypothetical protein